PVHIARPFQMFEQRAVAAAHIQHATVGFDHLGDGGKIGTQAHAMPFAFAAAFRKPRTVCSISGSSSRKASWPLSLSISTKLTFAAVALSAWAMRLFSGVGNSQSLVKEIRQNRALVLRKASASTPL